MADWGRHAHSADIEQRLQARAELLGAESVAQAVEKDGALAIRVGCLGQIPLALGDSRRQLVTQDGTRWVVTLAGYFGGNPPTDAAGFLAFAGRLPTRDV